MSPLGGGDEPHASGLHPARRQLVRTRPGGPHRAHPARPWPGRDAPDREHRQDPPAAHRRRTPRRRGGRGGPPPPAPPTTVDPVADSGLWQHLAVDSLPVTDAARLVAAVSDNVATNVLIELIGLDSVAETASDLGLTHTALLDIVRDQRTHEDPPALSTGNAAELARLCRDIEQGRALSPAASEQVRDWLSVNTDLSMVAAAFGLDPLAHVDTDRALRLWNKTGTNVGVRCDVGVMRHAARDDTEPVAYAVLARWQPDDTTDRTRDDVLATMREVGALVRAALP
jgi:beta-lactamase class A